jgi:F420-0:gamma-glutamyl ligase-like protein
LTSTSDYLPPFWVKHIFSKQKAKVPKKKGKKLQEMRTMPKSTFHDKQIV